MLDISDFIRIVLLMSQYLLIEEFPLLLAEGISLSVAFFIRQHHPLIFDGLLVPPPKFSSLSSKYVSGYTCVLRLGFSNTLSMPVPLLF